MIRTYYVTTTATRDDVSERFGCSRRTLDQKISDEGWVRLREDHQAQVAEETQRRALVKSAGKRLEVIDQVSNIRLAVLSKLVERIENGSYKANVADLVKLTLLQASLSGWSKLLGPEEGSRAGGGDVNVNVGLSLSIENVVAEIAERRAKAIEVLSSGGSANGDRRSLPADVETFMIGDAGLGDGDDGETEAEG